MSPSSTVFAVHLVVAIVFEILLHYVRGVNISPKLGWGSVFLFAASFLIWNLSRSEESPLCDPHLWLQGHALWHILDATAAVVVYLFYNTENNPEIA